MNKKMEIFIEELKKPEVLGNVSVACKRLGIGRQTVYDWKMKDVEFNRKCGEAIDYSREVIVEIAHNALIRAILKGKVSAIIYALKTYGSNGHDTSVRLSQDLSFRSSGKNTEQLFETHEKLSKSMVDFLAKTPSSNPI